MIWLTFKFIYRTPPVIIDNDFTKLEAAVNQLRWIKRSGQPKPEPEKAAQEQNEQLEAARTSGSWSDGSSTALAGEAMGPQECTSRRGEEGDSISPARPPRARTASRPDF